MSTTRRFRFRPRLASDSALNNAVRLILVILLVGTAGYAIIEGWSITDALYATVITITTVGYGDMAPMTPAGRIFAILFTLAAIGAVGYALSSFAAGLIEKHQDRRRESLRKQQMNRIAELKDHVIICGGGYVGKRVALQFREEGQSYVIVEADPDLLRWTLLFQDDDYRAHRYKQSFDITYDADSTDLEHKEIDELAELLEVPYVQDVPTSNAVLVRAGIERARGLLAIMGDDRDNLLVVLSARELARELGNEDLRIISRAIEEENIGKLHMAGADRVFSPNFVEAVQLSANMLHPHTGSLWRMAMSEASPLRFSEIHADNEPGIVGKTCAEIKQTAGSLVLSIFRDGEYLNVPNPEERCREGDVLVIMTERGPGAEATGLRG
jgi:voltage-gated potassium channel